MRYWHLWVVLSSHYTLGNNLNAYMCIELNAHSLISFILTLRNCLPDSGFLPWLLGSQSCEKAFRAAHSMSSIFSMVIFFVDCIDCMFSFVLNPNQRKLE